MRRMFSILAAAASLLPVLSMAQEQRGSPYSGDQFDDIRGEEDRRGPSREPISRAKFAAAVERLFAAADTNRDGTVTVAEVQAIIGGRREQAIQARFAQVDSNRDKTLSYDEFAAWQRALGSVVLADSEAGPAIVAEEIRLEPGRNRESALIASLMVPLSSTTVAAANTNYDAGMSLAELQVYEGQRFDALDANKDGFLNDDELRARGPRPAAGAAPPIK